MGRSMSGSLPRTITGDRESAPSPLTQPSPERVTPLGVNIRGQSKW